MPLLSTNERRVDRSAERLLAFERRRRSIGEWALGTAGGGHRDALLPGARHVGCVVEEIGAADRRHGRGPGVVGCGPGGQVRAGVADGRPVGAVVRGDDLNVPGHRVGGVGVEGLADEDHRRIGKVEGVDQAGVGATGQLRAGARDGRDVLGRLDIVLGRDLVERALDAAQAGLEGVDADALHVRMDISVGQRAVGDGELAHGRGDQLCNVLRSEVVTASANCVTAT